MSISSSTALSTVASELTLVTIQQQHESGEHARRSERAALSVEFLCTSCARSTAVSSLYRRRNPSFEGPPNSPQLTSSCLLKSVHKSSWRSSILAISSAWHRYFLASDICASLVQVSLHCLHPFPSLPFPSFPFPNPINMLTNQLTMCCCQLLVVAFRGMNTVISRQSKRL